MPEYPSLSEVDVLRTFVARVIPLQIQLDSNYHSDAFLRDRLFTAIDIPIIHSTLRDRLPCTSHQAVNRVANTLSYKAHSASSTSACMVEAEDDQFRTEAHYSLKDSFGGMLESHHAHHEKRSKGDERRTREQTT